jgi:type VI secretion system protein ImpF
LEDLLNAHWVHPDLPVDYEELRGSILCYGLPDLQGVNAASPDDQRMLTDAIQNVIARFEPRLRDIRAELLNPYEDKERRLRFRITARLAVDPAPAMAFDTILELTTGRYKVNASTS